MRRLALCSREGERKRTTDRGRERERDRKTDLLQAQVLQLSCRLRNICKSCEALSHHPQDRVTAPDLSQARCDEAWKRSPLPCLHAALWPQTTTPLFSQKRGSSADHGGALRKYAFQRGCTVALPGSRELLIFTENISLSVGSSLHQGFDLLEAALLCSRGKKGVPGSPVAGLQLGSSFHQDFRDSEVVAECSEH